MTDDKTPADAGSAGPAGSSPGVVVIEAICRAAALERAEHQTEDATIFIWRANAEEQIEAALREAGYELRSLAQIEQARLDRERLEWLHGPEETDLDGYEWGIYRVRWQNGRAVDVQATLADLSDLDAEIRRESNHGRAEGIMRGWPILWRTAAEIWSFCKDGAIFAGICLFAIGYGAIQVLLDVTGFRRMR